MRKYGLATLVASLVVIPLLASVAGAAPNFTDPNFKQLWERADKILTERPGVGRGFIWGPETIFSGRELYTEAQNEQRLVQYFDKARMEVNFTTGNRGDPNFVTSGLLVKELVLGRQQNGNDVINYTQGLPSEVQIAGDPNTGGNNAVAPTYRSFRNVTTFNNDNPADPRIGQQIFQRMDRAGNISNVTPPDSSIRISRFETATRHNVADVFVNYGNIQGQVWNGSGYVNGPLFFPNATYVFGLAITEPYWVRAVVANTEKDVLVQLFERRVLTYTPSNDINSRVEMGNVGAHYYRWRYLENLGFNGPNTNPNPNPTATAPTPTPAPLIPSNDYSQFRAPYLRSGPPPQGETSSSSNVTNYPTGSSLSNSSPAYDPDQKLAIIGTQFSGVVAVNVNNFSTPTQRWRFQPSGNPKFNVPPVLFNGIVYAGASDGRIYAIRESDGSQLWASSIATDSNGGIFSYAALDADSVYVTAGDGRLYAFNLSNGTPKWQVSLGGGLVLSSGPVIGPNGWLYVNSSDNRIYAFNRDGTRVDSSSWNLSTLDGTLLASPAFGNGRLYVGTGNGTLYAFNSNGTIQSFRNFTSGKAINSTPAVVSINGANRVYVSTRDGKVYGVDANNVATVVWTFATSTLAEINSSVAVVDNFVYVAADDKKVYRVEANNSFNSLVLITADDIFDTNSPVVNSGLVFIAPRSNGKLLIVK